MATVNATPTKTRKPPTFQHLPINRAKKLKRTWVEVQKIKSKWKAQKRKEGLVSTKRPTVEDAARSSADDSTKSNEAEWKTPKDGDESDADAPGGAESDDGDVNQEAESDEDSVDEDARPKKLPRFTSSKGRAFKGRGGVPKPDNTQEKPSLRELNKMAYSRSSLHTYKSNRSHADNSVRSRGRGSFTQRGRGRGQPDMRLRMNAMLEKIKKDLV